MKDTLRLMTAGLFYILIGCSEPTNFHIMKILSNHTLAIKLDKSFIELSNSNKDNFLSIANFSSENYLINIEYNCGKKQKKYHDVLISNPAIRLNSNTITSVNISLINDNGHICNDSMIVIKALKLGSNIRANKKYEELEVPILWI